jgi:hypothetical protein
VNTVPASDPTHQRLIYTSGDQINVAGENVSHTKVVLVWLFGLILQIAAIIKDHREVFDDTYSGVLTDGKCYSSPV